MTVHRIGLIGAMDEEIKLCLQQLTEVNAVMSAGIQYYEGLLCNQQVVVCKSGVGKVNAAVCTQILINQFAVDSVWFTGVAGALHPSLEIGDMVISTESMQHDMDVTALGFPLGTIPYHVKSLFEADRMLVELAYESSKKLFAGQTLKGRVLSGDQFISDRNKVKELYEEMGGVCTEMEGAAVAQVCSMNNIPFVIIRSMSDKADGSAHVDFAQFTEEASKRSYQLIVEMIMNMR